MSVLCLLVNISQIDHMLKIYYHEALGGWQIPEITPLENLVLHPASKVLHYAIEVRIIYIQRIKRQTIRICFV